MSNYVTLEDGNTFFIDDTFECKYCDGIYHNNDKVVSQFFSEELCLDCWTSERAQLTKESFLGFINVMITMALVTYLIMSMVDQFMQ